MRPSSAVDINKSRFSQSRMGKSMNNSGNVSQNSINSNKYTAEYNEMDLQRIKEFIAILEEHQMKCEKEKKFVDAEIAKQKVAQLKQVEKEKILNDLKFNHEDELNSFETEKKSILAEFNQEWDANYHELQDKFAEFEQRLQQQQQQDLNEKIEEFDRKYHPITKPTSEILNLQKILNGLIRQKEYIKAHQIQTQIDKLSVIDMNIFMQEKEKKLGVVIDKLKMKHHQEYQVLVAKKELSEAEFNKNRKNELDKLLQSFKNRQKEIEIHQNNELSQILNPRKFLARNINKSRQGNTRMHSSVSMDRTRSEKFSKGMI